MIRNIIFKLVIILLIFSACKTKSNIIDTTNITEEKPYIILISLDGFRWDYVEKYKPPHLSNFIKNGVKSTSLIPSFPSKTFPNHYTIATGMFPDKHGIINNTFYSYNKKALYQISDRKKVEDGSFYKGTPIWVSAEKASIRTASYFFIGSDANVKGIRPTYYKKYDGSIKNKSRITQLFNWLSLPLNKRPQLITMYFSDLDDKGHKYSPNNEAEIKKALLKLDKDLGLIFKKSQETELPINIVIVSDHGMTTLATENLIPIESIKNDNLYMTINNGSIISIHPKKSDELDIVFNYLQQKEINFKVYKTENTPGFEYKPKSKNWGAIQIIPNFGYYFSTEKRILSLKNKETKILGVHGYNPTYKDMHGVFYANGPAFKNNFEINSIKNIHIYPILCKILGLKIPKNIDGKLSELEPILAE